MDRAIREAVADDPLAATLRFEDVFSEEAGGIWKVVDFLKLRPRLAMPEEEFLGLLGRKANVTKKYELPAWEGWTPGQKEQFASIAGSHMELHGYTL